MKVKLIWGMEMIIPTFEEMIIPTIKGNDHFLKKVEMIISWWDICKLKTHICSFGKLKSLCVQLMVCTWRELKCKWAYFYESQAYIGHGNDHSHFWGNDHSHFEEMIISPCFDLHLLANLEATGLPTGLNLQLRSTCGPPCWSWASFHGIGGLWAWSRLFWLHDPILSGQKLVH